MACAVLFVIAVGSCGANATPVPAASQPPVTVTAPAPPPVTVTVPGPPVTVPAAPAADDEGGGGSTGSVDVPDDVPDYTPPARAPRLTRTHTGNTGHPCQAGERDGDGDGYCGEGR